MNRYRHVHELIGQTPMIELTSFALPNHVRLFAKLEFMNPGGSIKDRLGLRLMQEAIDKGKITKKRYINRTNSGKYRDCTRSCRNWD